jgi:hypothetical protein
MVSILETRVHSRSIENHVLRPIASISTPRLRKRRHPIKRRRKLRRRGGHETASVLKIANRDGSVAVLIVSGCPISLVVRQNLSDCCSCNRVSSSSKHEGRNNELNEVKPLFPTADRKPPPVKKFTVISCLSSDLQWFSTSFHA